MILRPEPETGMIFVVGRDYDAYRDLTTDELQAVQRAIQLELADRRKDWNPNTPSRNKDETTV